jgi:hypothetical protein
MTRRVDCEMGSNIHAAWDCEKKLEDLAGQGEVLDLAVLGVGCMSCHHLLGGREFD